MYHHHALITTYNLGVKTKLSHQNLLGGFVIENVFLPPVNKTSRKNTTNQLW